jgi:hypothetical protein
MTCNGVYPSAVIDTGPDLTGPPWYSGQAINKKIPQPLVYTLDSEQPGNIPAMLDAEVYPLMRVDVIEALKAVGVDNLQFFDAVIIDPATGAEHHEYKAFNIIGVVAAADMAKSVKASSSDSVMIDADFDSLAIDATKAGAFRLFRLAESVDAIIVDGVVKQAIEQRNIPGMVFYDPADWAG